MVQTTRENQQTTLRTTDGRATLMTQTENGRQTDSLNTDEIIGQPAL